MSTASKVAVSLPSELLERLDRTVEASGRSRSAVVAEAIRAWLRDAESSAEDRRYVESYLSEPERTDELAGIAAEAAAGWEPWE